jgi:hypothetical protein
MSEVKVNKISPRTGTDVELNSSAKITNFTSTGIDDNASSTAVTLSSTGRMGLGNTSPEGAFHIKVLSDTADIKIESSGGSGKKWTIGSRTDGALQFYDSTGASEIMRLTSSGLHIGGTGSANALDDYEEGTWTPRFNRDTSLSSVSYTRQQGVYTKIGQTVIAWFDLIVASYSGGGGDYGLHGLPFTSNLGSTYGGFGIPLIRGATLMPTDFRIYGNSSYHVTNTDYFYFRNYNSSGTEVASSPNSSGRVSGYTVYTTSS